MFSLIRMIVATPFAILGAVSLLISLTIEVGFTEATSRLGDAAAVL